MSPESRYSDTEFLHSLAASGQFDRLVRYLVSNEALVVRRRAAALLAKYGAKLEGDTDHTERLRSVVLQDTDDTVRAKAIETLLAVEEDIIDSLVNAIKSDAEPTPTDSPHPLLFFHWLDSQHAVLRELAVAGLGGVGTPAVIPKLADACTDNHPRVQRRALVECGRVGDSRCVDSVADCLDSEEQAVCTAAATALGAIGTDEAIQALFSAAERDNLAIRRRVLSELGGTGSLNALGCLLHGLDGDTESVQDAAVAAIVELIAEAPREESHLARETIAVHLDSRPTDDVVPRLVSLVHDTEKSVIRRNAVWLLNRIAADEPRQSVIDCFLHALSDTDAKTAEVAVSGLVQIDDPVVVDKLETFIRRNDLRSATLGRADFIRDQVTDDGASEQRKNAVVYTEVSEPADYTVQHANDDTR